MRKKTKIVATISDQHCDVEFISKLRAAGMNVVRLNTAHMDRVGAMEIINNVRNVSKRIAILIDTKGPEIRTTEASEVVPVTFGDKVIFKGDKNGISGRDCIYVNYNDFVHDVSVGSRILIDDGNLELMVIDKNDEKLICEVRNEGIIEGRKSVNIPSVNVKLPALTKKDIDFIEFAIEQDLDFIAHSFVRHKEDVQIIQDMLDKENSKVKIIAKIENQEGVDNIDEILSCAYGVMVARGDLAVEIPQERIPAIQNMIVEKCVSRRKPVIIATQMLHSMIKNPRPTRAEISDVANAIYGGTDAMMLSGETAYGKYPISAVQTMTNIALEIEQAKPRIKETPMLVVNNEISAFLAYNAVKASIDLGTKAIISDTQEGKSIRALAAYRGDNIIIAQCYSKRTMRELALSYGVYVNYMKKDKSRDMFIRKAVKSLKKKFNINPDERVVVLAGNYGEGTGLSFMQIDTMAEIHNSVFC